MKKALLGTTALVAASALMAGGVQAAEPVTAKLGGYMEQTVGVARLDVGDGCVSADNCPSRDGFDIFQDAEIFFVGEGMVDNGLTFGFNVQLEAQSDDSSDRIDEAYLYVESDSLGQLLIGSENMPNYKMAVEYPTVSRAGLSSGDYTFWLGNPEGQSNSDSPVRSTTGRFRANDPMHIAYYSPRFYGLQLGVGYAPGTGEGNSGGIDAHDGSIEDILSAAVNFKRDFNGIGVHAAFGVLHIDDFSTGRDKEATGYNTGLQVRYGGFTVGGGLSWTNDDFNLAQSPNGYGFNVGGKYATGPYAFSLGFAMGEAEGGSADGEDERTAAEGAVLYNAGPGVKLHASIAYEDIDGDGTGETEEQEGVVGIAGVLLSF